MAGWGNFFGKIADQFQGRIERLKNEEKRLEKERKDIQATGISNERNNTRIAKIDVRLTEINNILKNNAKD